jgi:hypothetical protein
MATRSNIAIQLPNGKFKQIYAHWDGYPSNNGKILLEHYQDPKKIKKLIALGGVSSLDKELYMPNGTLRDFDCRNSELDVCKFYMARGDDEKAVTMQMPICEQEWLYVWMKKLKDENPRWYYAHYTWNIGYYKPLTEEICNDDKNFLARFYSDENHCWLDESYLKCMVRDGEIKQTTEFINKD